MKPIIHAQSSAKKFGGKADLYFPLHQLMDISKSSMPDVRHRMLFHHDKGITLMQSIFGKDIQISSTKKVPVKSIAVQHVMEDLSFIPPLQKYLDVIPMETWIKQAYNGFPNPTCTFAKQYPAVYKFIKKWISKDPRSIILVCNTLFPYIVETTFGPLTKGKPTRDIVENFIGTFVEIQGLEFLLDDMKIESWMIRPELLQGNVFQPPTKKQKVIYKKETIIHRDPMSIRLD